MKKAASIIFFILFCTIVSAQQPQFGISSAKQNGSSFIIEYNLTLGERMKWCDVMIQLSVDGGKTFIETPLKAVSGDVGRITSSGPKQIIWRAKEERHLITSNEISFRIYSEVYHHPKPLVPGAFLIEATAGVFPDLSYGVMFGWAKRAGFYVKARSNFVFNDTKDYCDNQARTPYGYLWTTGNKQISRYSLTAGALVRTIPSLYIYAGAGYGERKLLWEDISGQWAYVENCTYKGICADLGVLLRFGKISVSLGGNWTQSLDSTGGYIDGEIGVGIVF